MHRCRQFRDVLLEEPEGVGVCQHDPRHVTVEVLAQDRRADEAPLVRRDANGGVAGEAYRGRVGPVRRVRDQHLGRRPARLLVPGADYEQPGQLTGGAGGRLQGRGGHTRDSGTGRWSSPTAAPTIPGHMAPAWPGARSQGQATPPPRRTPWGCTSSCKTREGRRRGRPSTACGIGAVICATRSRSRSRPAPAARGGARRPGPAPRPATQGPRWSGTKRNGGPGTEKSKIVGSSSWPSSGAELAFPPGAALRLSPLTRRPFPWHPRKRRSRRGCASRSLLRAGRGGPQLLRVGQPRSLRRPCAR